VLGGRTLPFEQLPDASKSRVDVGRCPLEVSAEIVQEVGERSGVEVLRPVRLVSRLHPCLVECGPQLTLSPVMSCLRPLVPHLERLQASPQITNHLAPRFCQRESLLPGGGKVRPSAEVQIGPAQIALGEGSLAAERVGLRLFRRPDRGPAPTSLTWRPRKSPNAAECQNSLQIAASES
jgi:hypothetical protein